MGAGHLAPFPRVTNKCKEDRYKEFIASQQEYGEQDNQPVLNINNHAIRTK